MQSLIRLRKNKQIKGSHTTLMGKTGRRSWSLIQPYGASYNQSYHPVGLIQLRYGSLEPEMFENCLRKQDTYKLAYKNEITNSPINYRQKSAKVKVPISVIWSGVTLENSSLMSGREMLS